MVDGSASFRPSSSNVFHRSCSRCRSFSLARLAAFSTFIFSSSNTPHRPSTPPSASCGRVSAAGRKTAVEIFSVRRWVAGSNSPMVSISSPQNSVRTGASAAGENTSSRLPRRANCPGPSTWSHRVYPAATRRRDSCPRSQLSPRDRVSAVCSSSSGGRVRCSNPSTVATTKDALSWDMA